VSKYASLSDILKEVYPSSIVTWRDYNLLSLAFGPVPRESMFGPRGSWPATPEWLVEQDLRRLMEKTASELEAILLVDGVGGDTTRRW
jgi:hypothetical protein